MSEKGPSRDNKSRIRKRAFRSTAPTRIDLAGGTIDIWPLYLFHDNAVTVNVAIDLLAEADVEERKDSKMLFISKDQKLTFETDKTFRHLERTPLEFLARIAEFYRPRKGLTVISRCHSPAGAGLGGSSALGVALGSALNSLCKRGYSQKYQMNVIKNIETRILGVPTGEQDYYSAILGGLNFISYGMSGSKVQKLPVDLGKLQSRLVLCFSGKERQSGLSNWDMVKRYIDGQLKVKRAMENICSAASSMVEALRQNDFNTAGEILKKEWESRKMLSPKVSNRKIERLIREACKGGAIGGKVCGAGGGGCLVFITEENKKRTVERRVAQCGGKILRFEICQTGVKVRKR